MLNDEILTINRRSDRHKVIEIVHRCEYYIVLLYTGFALNILNHQLRKEGYQYAEHKSIQESTSKAKATIQ